MSICKLPSFGLSYGGFCFIFFASVVVPHQTAVSFLPPPLHSQRDFFLITSKQTYPSSNSYVKAGGSYLYPATGGLQPNCKCILMTASLSECNETCCMYWIAASTAVSIRDSIDFRNNVTQSITFEQERASKTVPGRSSTTWTPPDAILGLHPLCY